MNFGSYIKEMREGKKISLREAAKLSEISHPYLSQLENSRNNKPSMEIINKLSKGLGIPNGDLMMRAGYIDDPFEYANNQKKLESAAKAFNTSSKDLFDLYFLLNMDADLYYKNRILNDSDKEKIKTMLKIILE